MKFSSAVTFAVTAVVVYAGYLQNDMRHKESPAIRATSSAEEAKNVSALDEYVLNHPISADFLISSLLASSQETNSHGFAKEAILDRQLNANSLPPGCHTTLKKGLRESNSRGSQCASLNE